MKMIDGEASLACLKRSRTRERADADDRLDELRRRDREERHAGLARPRRARAASCRCPGGPDEQHAARDPAAEPAVAVRVLEEVDDLGELRLGLVDAGHVVEGDLSARRPRRAARGSARSCRARPSRRRPPPGGRDQTNSPTSRITGPKPRIRLSSAPRPCVDRLGLDRDVVVLQQLRDAVGVGREGRDLRLEVARGLRARLALRRVGDRLLEVALDRLALRRRCGRRCSPRPAARTSA